MKVSINWLSEYVDIAGKGPEQIADILSDLGFPLEGIVKKMFISLPEILMER